MKLFYSLALTLATGSLCAQWTTYDMSNSSIASNSCYRAVVDPLNNDVLVGTANGLSVKSGSSWTTHNVASGALGHNTAVISYRDGSNLWVTTDGGGVSRYNGTSWTIFNTGNSNLADDRCYAINKAANGILWIGTRDNGLASYNGTTFSAISISANVSVTYDRVQDMDIDASGIIWIGSAGGGLVKYNPATNQWVQYSTGNSTILHDDVYSVRVAPDGMVWAGTFGGLSIFNPNTGVFTNHLSSLNTIMTNNYIRGISWDELGRGYIAMAYGGVARVETNYTISTMWTSSNSNLGSDTIWHLEYGNGSVWAAGFNEGLFQLNIDVAVNELHMPTLELTLFPVPSTGDVTLNISVSENTEVKVEVYNMTGQMIWSSGSVGIAMAADNKILIPMANYAAGTYSVAVTDEKTALRVTKQLIRQ